MDHNDRAIVTLVAGVACGGQLAVSRSELTAILGLNGPVERRQRFFDRGGHHIGDREIAIFRQELGKVSEGVTQLLQLIGRVRPILLMPGETKLDVAGLNQRGHQIANSGRVWLLRVRGGRPNERSCNRYRSDRSTEPRYFPLHEHINVKG
jgi:hypothetical protein